MYLLHRPRLPILSSATANAHGMPKSDAPTGNITSAHAHAGAGRLQMAESSVMDTCLCSRSSPPHHIQFQIRPRRWMWYLCMRATRFKSESHKRALALRSPPPTSGSKSGSASGVGASGR
ncbi:hypothetical protein FIBSPDRAFT_296852 [Athelia psychrophila]|uniref:Uncharacterized protein n=1 Tax=Athelia psychrophila TaxID=1759441 RepID=A0A167X974_9AGAM|nr:hypothetical protein FIBSPDRAFT_296852 [Fibularhizoctonia sp. CBS 109695]